MQNKTLEIEASWMAYQGEKTSNQVALEKDRAFRLLEKDSIRLERDRLRRKGRILPAHLIRPHTIVKKDGRWCLSLGGQK